MKLEADQINHFKESFAKMQTKNDFLNLLNEAKLLIYGENALPFELKQLTWFGNQKLGGKRYHEFKIKKKSGSERSIHAPVNGLKALQRCVALLLQCTFNPHHAAFGFVTNKSIVDNASLHVGNRYVFNIDLKDFFPSVNQARIWKCLQLPPFNLSRESSLKNGFLSIPDSGLDFNHEKGVKKWESPKKGRPVECSGEKPFEDNRLGIANLIASISCAEMEVDRKNEFGEWVKVRKSVLPQGAPTSPVLTNIVCQKLDFLLSAVAKRFGLKYSRYADDITFSASHNEFQRDGEFLTELHRIIHQQGFYIKESKTRLQKDGYRKEVTGLLVNEKVNVPKRYIKQLRMWLYYWERYGLDRASQIFTQQYLKDKGHVKNGNPDMANVISGKLDYLRMVRGDKDSLTKGLIERFKSVNGLNITKEHSDILKKSEKDILDLIFDLGLDKAMENFNPDEL